MLRAARTVLLATLVLAACGEDVEDEPGAAVWAGDVSGAYTGTIAGKAEFGVTLDDAAKAGGFALILGGTPSAARIVLIAPTTPKPRAGTYEIVGPDFSAGDDTVFTGTITYGFGIAPDSFAIQGGTITLDRANHSRTSGTFVLSATRTYPADGAQVVVSGSFDAGQIPQEFPQPRR